MSPEDVNEPNHQILVSRLLAGQQWEHALRAARDWLAEDPEKVRAHLAAGQSLLNLERHEEALPHLQQVISKDPENDVVHRFISIIYFKRERFKEAYEAIHRAIAMDPQDAYHWYHLAHMCYRRHDRESALKYAEKARSLAPRDPDILNLVAMCQSRGATRYTAQLQQYEMALELDPENPEVHNNIGVYHMQATLDYAAAETCFRRALHFDPTLKVARSNLFIALKHRDHVYRLLCFPRDGVYRILNYMRAKRRQSVPLFIIMLVAWVALARYLLLLLILWFLLVWPMVKVYEFLTLADIRSRAGEVGARRGGFWEHRRWSLKLRLWLFAGLLLLFWGTISLLVFNLARKKTSHDLQVIMGSIVLIGAFSLIGYRLWDMLKKGLSRWQSRRKGRQIESLLESENEES